MATKNDVATTSEAAPAPTETRRTGLGGLAIAGIAVGAVIVAGALFGGGVVVGTHLPSQTTQSQFGPGGERPDFGGERPDFGGERPAMPGMPGQGVPEGDGS